MKNVLKAVGLTAVYTALATATMIATFEGLSMLGNLIEDKVDAEKHPHIAHIGEGLSQMSW